MVKEIKKLIITFICIFLIINFVNAKNKTGLNQKLMNTFNIEHEKEFGSVYIKISIDDFNKLGYQYGDSVDIKFSNSTEIKDVPYYSGYNTRVNMPILVAYPGYKYIAFAYSSGKPAWVEHNLSETDTVTIKLNKKAKYLAIEKALNLKYTCNYDDYKDEIIFGNFREVCSDKLKPNTFYRGASPCDNQYNRAKYVDNLIEKNNIKYIVNLADNVERVNKYMSKAEFDSNYFKSLYEKNNVCLVRLNANYQSQVYATKVVNAFREMMKNEGPYYIHCTEGKDRTGVVCALINILAGATYEQVLNDYMITYDNYYKINKQSDLEKYKAIVENKFIDIYQIIIESKSDRDYSGYIGSEDAKTYLRKGGMSEEEIVKFVKLIKK